MKNKCVAEPDRQVDWSNTLSGQCVFRQTRSTPFFKFEISLEVMCTAKNFALDLNWKIGEVLEIRGRFPILGQSSLEKGFVFHKDDFSLTTVIAALPGTYAALLWEWALVSWPGSERSRTGVKIDQQSRRKQAAQRTGRIRNSRRM